MVGAPWFWGGVRQLRMSIVNNQKSVALMDNARHKMVSVYLVGMKTVNNQKHVKVLEMIDGICLNNKFYLSTKKKELEKKKKELEKKKTY